MEHPLVRQLKEREKAAQALIQTLGREVCGDKDHVIEIHANKRWLARREKDLLAAERSLYQEHELVAVGMAIKALKTKKGAAKFRKRLAELSIKVVGGVAGATGSYETSEYTAIPAPRKRKAPKSLAKVFDTPSESMAVELTGNIVELDFPVLEWPTGIKAPHLRRKTGTRERTPQKSR